jgi:hypothetical protein
MYDPQPQLLRFPDSLNYNNCDNSYDYSVVGFKATSTITIKSIAVDFLTFTANSQLKIDAYIANYDGSINNVPDSTALVNPDRVYSINFVDVSNALVDSATRKNAVFTNPIVLQNNQTVYFRFYSTNPADTFVFNSVGGLYEDRYNYCCSVWAFDNIQSGWSSGNWNSASNTIDVVGNSPSIMPYIEIYDYTTGMQNGVCGSDHFYCVVGESTSIVGSSTTHWLWTCDGVNGGNSVSCSEPFGGTSSTTSSTTLPVIAQSECGITSGDLILGCIKNAFAWAVNVDPSVSDDFSTLMNRLKTKAPIGYVTSIIEVFRFQHGTGQTMILIESGNPLMTYIFDPLRSILAIIIYVFSAVWLFNRVKNIHI